MHNTVLMLNKLTPEPGMTINWLETLKDKHIDTYRHSLRVAWLAEKLTSLLPIADRDRQEIVGGCLLHDIGKLMIPNEILDSMKPLTSKEWELIKEHPQLGAYLLRHENIGLTTMHVIRHHHERWDGTGYPSKLRGQHIPYGATVCSVLDAFDSMVVDRPYREGKPIEEAISELFAYAGTQFSLPIVECFASIADQVRIFYEAPVRSRPDDQGGAAL
ncbi:HD-GYP domain-containing protein [Cohnella hashimotonis]|uniref:HD domain-containing protein n=1 Tax=Cohnella hashimotonis TaxID=2826895 RepID=A0ABT6TT69_9BACL|nr:HD domain-containing phosphohydrolase [Cohnella hashimotonis]MDI4649480.1 HD domain-containing protein [Cohnella hashimotonis]